MQRILVMPNRDRDPDFTYTKEVLACLSGQAEVVLCEDFAKELPGASAFLPRADLYKEVSCVIALGGDGTLLQAAREAAVYKRPVLGINLGYLGFLTEVERHEIKESLARVLSGDYMVEERLMLQGVLQRKEKETIHFEALNDIVVARSCGTRLIDLHLCLDGEPVDEFKADGMIIATPTGSTAYSMSAGGPIVDPAVESILLTPICPHKLYAKNLVVPGSRSVTITVSERNPLPAMVTADGQRETEFAVGDTLTVKKSEHLARFIRIHGNHFYSVLHHKLLGKER